MAKIQDILRNPFRKKTLLEKKSIRTPLMYAVPPEVAKLQEQFKGKTETPEQRVFGTDIKVEPHPTDYEILEKTYRNIPLAFGLVNKYIDFIMSGGIFVKSEDERAKEIIEQFIKDSQFNILVRSWLREGLIKGWGVLELAGSEETGITEMKVHNSNSFFNTLDEKGDVDGYIQDIGKNQKPIPFSLTEIATISINPTASSHYGLGVLHPVMIPTNNVVGSEKDMHVIMSRKANSPYIINTGTEEEPVTQTGIDEIGKKLEFLNNKHEWVFDHVTQVKALDFGNIGDKFTPVLNHDVEMFIFGSQFPAVLFGFGNIPEGLANVQMEGLMRTITSMQDEIEKVIETQIFKRVLNSQGIDSHVELEWGQPSNEEKNKRIKTIVEILKIQSLDIGLRIALEKELAVLLDLEVVETPEDERKREDEEQQPRVPGQNRDEKLNEGYDFELEDYRLREWLNFNFSRYLGSIISFINTDNFDLLREKELSNSQIIQLKSVLKGGFIRGASMKEISNQIEKRVRPAELKGASIKIRSMRIARTEVTRTAFEGSIADYKKEQVTQVKFVSSLGQRTCPQCDALQGRIFSINEAQGLIPVHANCRCTMTPVVEV